MFPFPIPENEQERLETLRSLGVMHTPGEERFDRVTRLASAVTTCPIALVGLLEEKYQWFKSIVGLDTDRTDRCASFCTHAIMREDAFVVPDALDDPRFRDNPLVTGAPGIRAYLGIPLRMPNGHCVGTLCAIDQEARDFTEGEISSMLDLANLAADELSKSAFNRTVAQLEEVTEQLRERQNELEQARRKAEKSSEAKTRFLATMSHEIRTPLHGIIGFLDELGQVELEDDLAEYVRLATACSESLLGTINDILDLSKIEAGELVLERIPFKPTECVEAVRASFDHRAREKKLYLRKQIAIDDSLTLLGDPHRLTQILTNLLGNALKFTGKGGVTLSLRSEETSGEESDIRLIAEVADTGIGIPQEKLCKLFRPFEQLETSTSRKFGGTGLGLSICRELVEGMKGEIKVESEEWVGSRFMVSIPFKRDLKRVPVEIRPRSNGGNGAKTGYIPRVLVAEDNPVNQRVMQMMLNKMKVKADYASNGREAVNRVKAGHDYDVILTDIQMPEMDGYETCRAIRELTAHRKRPRILALTAHAMVEERCRCLKAGMDGVLSKPFKPEDLREVLGA